jgi:hypothetical protein
MAVIVAGTVIVVGSGAASSVATGELSSSGSVGGVGETQTVVITVTVDVVERVEKAVVTETTKLDSGLVIVWTRVETGSTIWLPALEASTPNVLGAAVLSGEGIAWRKVDIAGVG